MVIILEGLFALSNEGHIQVHQADGQVVDVLDQLMPLVGQRVRIALHHVPPSPPDPNRWGGGCCHWQPSKCPAGHHVEPASLHNVSFEGLFLVRDSRFEVVHLNGKVHSVAFGLLLGHDARIAAASLLDVAAMRESLEKQGLADVETLGGQAKDLREILARFKAHVTKGEGE